jgi:hypothetical protein
LTTRLPNASQQAAADAVVDRLDAGAAAGHVEIRTGSQPADADTAASGTLLVDIELGDPAFGAADATGAAAIAGTPSGTAVAAGTAGYARFYDSDDNPVFDVACGEGSGELDFDNTDIGVGQSVTIATFTYTHPAE